MDQAKANMGIPVGIAKCLDVAAAFADTAALPRRESNKQTPGMQFGRILRRGNSHSACFALLQLIQQRPQGAVALAAAQQASVMSTIIHL